MAQLSNIISFKSLNVLAGNLQDCLYLPVVPKVNSGSIAWEYDIIWMSKGVWRKHIYLEWSVNQVKLAEDTQLIEGR